MRYFVALALLLCGLFLAWLIAFLHKRPLLKATERQFAEYRQKLHSKLAREYHSPSTQRSFYQFDDTLQEHADYWLAKHPDAIRVEPPSLPASRL
jgi:hypothetical protein